MPAPPYSSSTVTPSTPRSPSLRQRSAGNSLSRSIAAARGAISTAANASTVLRSMSAVSPRSKFRPGRRLGRVAIPAPIASISNDGTDAFSAPVPCYHYGSLLQNAAAAPHAGPGLMGETKMITALSYVHGAVETPLLGETLGATFDRAAARHGDRPGLIVRQQ